MHLRLVTYNIHKGIGTDRVRRLDRIADVLRHYQPDVVALQEVLWAQAPRAARTQPQEIADALGMRHGVVALNVRRRNGVYGNVTLSHVPLEDHGNVDLTLRFKKPRAALYTRLRLPGGRLHLFNVHLGLARFERTRQMRRLLREVHELVPAHEPLVIVGDTNDWRHRLFGRVLADAGFACAGGTEDDPGHATFPSWYPVSALDKVFVRGHVRLVRAYPSRLALARVASDHLPVVVELELPPR